MDGLQETFLGLGVALGIGFLIGVDRERRKGDGPTRAAAGVRTFVLVSLLGATGQLTGELTGLLLAAGVATVLAAVSYWRSSEDDPGLTTETALVLTCLLGGLAMRKPVLAGALGTLVALLLASRSWLHAFISQRLSDREIMDGLLLAGAGLVVLPILPDRAIDPYEVINPRLIWTLALLVMFVNAAGYVALRTLGPTAGLALSGLAGGFVSSTATIATMGTRSRDHRELLRPAVAGAALSSIATVVQLAIIIAVTNRALLRPLWPALIAAGIVAVAYGAAFSWHAAKAKKPSASAEKGRAFEIKTPLILAAAITAVSFAAAFLTARYGSGGGLLGIGLAGFADSHSSAASAANLAKTGALSANAGVLAVLLAFATNSVTKAVVAWTTGGAAFALRVIPGVALMLVAAGAAALVTGRLAAG
jgi:uncharacterized membrane protein (DUF4010 family)